MPKVDSVVVGIVQINNGFSDQNYLPYVAGLLEAYSHNHSGDPDRYKFLMPLYKREHVDTYSNHLEDANIIAFSTYVWNYRISLAVAEKLKQTDPDKLVILGGPQVPDSPDGFFDENPSVDILVHGEGEQVFLDLLEAFPENDWSDIPGISYRDQTGDLVTHPKAPRFMDISTLPSPYLEGTFDSLMSDNPDEQWIVLWETNRGCPFSCTFCDWGSLVQAKVLTFDIERLKAEIDWMSEKKINYVFTCDANFGILPRDVDIVKTIAKNKARCGFPQRVGVQNTKNATERAYEIQKILTEAELTNGVDLALQSVDEHTLDLIKRKNISLDTYEELQRRFNRDGIPTFSDIILGLPGETYESFVNGVSRVISNGQHNRIEFQSLTILPNAEMGAAAYQVEHGMEMVEAPTINTHGIANEFEDGIFETEQRIVSTSSMTKEELRRVRVFSWMTSFLHLAKVLQLPLLVTYREVGLSFRELIEAFTTIEGSEFPLLGEIRDTFAECSAIVQDGGPEYIYSADWLGIYWPLDEYILIKLCREEKLEQFYQEAGRVLLSLSSGKIPAELMDDALRFNRALLKLPFQDTDYVIELRYNLLSYCRAIVVGDDPVLEERPTTYRIERSDQMWASWDDWLREVIWFCGKRGTYLYQSISEETPSTKAQGAPRQAAQTQR